MGGGPSLATAVEDLKNWPGDIWACGSPYQWLRERGIEAVFFNIDPLEETVDLARGAKNAILSTTNHPAVFGVVESVETFDLGDYAVVITSAGTAPHVAIHMGYTDISFFGCDSSFITQTHVYKSENDWEAIIVVRCGRESYATKPQLLIQAQALSMLIREMPSVFKDRSAGLLSAMVENEDYDVTHWNDAMRRLAQKDPLRMTHPDLPDLYIVSPQERYEAMKRGYA